MASIQGGEPHEHGAGHGRHGNPEDLDAYIAKMEAADRESWQQPNEVLRALDLKPGQSVCDIGAGPGYFALRAARAVGETGAVFAVDVEPRILEVLRDRIQRSGLRNLVPILALPDDPLLPQTCDWILIVDTFHHFPDPVRYLQRLRRSLKQGGHLVNIDFHKRELPVGPPLEHKVSRDTFLAHAAAAGFTLKVEHRFLPYQYFLILVPKN